MKEATIHLKHKPIINLIPPDAPMKWTWSLRNLQKENCDIINCIEGYQPKSGDVVVLEVEKVGNHTRIFSMENKYIRLYEGDLLVGTMGYRYATDAFHADTFDLGNLHLITNSGIIATVSSKHTCKTDPTRVRVVGLIKDKKENHVLNLTNLFFHPTGNIPAFPPVVIVVGTGMNSGKTTSIARIGKSLVEKGLSLSILKITGSASNRDSFEFESVLSKHVADFSDYGFPSTYLCTQQELESLYTSMIEDTLSTKPDLVLIEIADGILQRETQMLLKSSLIKSSCIGLVLTAPCACSALYLVEKAKELEYVPIAITGIITNSPLFVKEFKALNATPILNTKNKSGQIADLIQEHIQHQLAPKLQQVC